MTINRPVLGVSVLVTEAGRVLLVERGRDPFKGYWSLPGGHVEGGEKLAEAAARELLEETSIRAADLQQIDIREILGDDGRHFVLVVFAARRASGDPTAGDDAADVRWVAFEDVAHLKLTEDTRQLIARHMGQVR